MLGYVNFEPAHRRAACRCRVAERGARQAGRRAAPLSAERPHDAASPRSPPASWMASPIASCAPASPAEDDDGCSSLRIVNFRKSAAPSSSGNVRPARVRIAQAAQRSPARSTRSTVRPQRRHCHVIDRCSHVSGLNSRRTSARRRISRVPRSDATGCSARVFRGPLSADRFRADPREQRRCRAAPPHPSAGRRGRLVTPAYSWRARARRTP